MSKVFRFEGYSDDTFGEYQQTNDDYDTCAQDYPVVYELHSPSTGERMLVVGHYSHIGNGCWLIGVTNADDSANGGEELPLPQWPTQFEQGERSYTPALTIDAPDDTELRCVTREERAS